jgi:hypothetical protein
MAGTVATLTRIPALGLRPVIFHGLTHPVALVHPAPLVPGLPRQRRVLDIDPQLPAADSLVAHRLLLPVIRLVAGRCRMLALVAEAVAV